MIQAKDFRATKEMIDATARVLAAMAVVETIRPIVEGYQKAILAKHQWHIAKEWVERGLPDIIILSPKQAYELEQEDFKIYLAECNEARKQAGLYVENEEYCPLLVAEHELSKAQRALADVFEPITGLSADTILCSRNGLDHYKEYIDLILKLMVSYVNG